MRMAVYVIILLCGVIVDKLEIMPVIILEALLGE